MKFKSCVATISFFLMSLEAFDALAGEIFVYRNKNNAETLNLDEARKIINSSRLTWNSGETIVVMLDELAQMTESQFSGFSEISKSQFLDNWRIKFFSGRAMVPIQVKRSSSGLETLEENPSGIYFTFKPIELKEKRLKIKMEKISY